MVSIGDTHKDCFSKGFLMSQLVVIREYFDTISANLDLSILESSGISAHVQSDDMGGTRPDLLMVGRVRLMVRGEDYESAQVLLESVIQPPLDEENSDPIPHPKEYQSKLRIAFFCAIVGLIVLPPLLTHVYSLSLLFSIRNDWGKLTSVEKRKFAVTMALNILGTILGSYLIIAFFNN